MKINAHGHLLPDPSQIPLFMKEKEIFWIEESSGKKYMRQGTWRRPVTDPSFFLKNKIRWMEEEGIDHEVVITLSQLYCNGMEQGITSDVIRFQNDYHAYVQDQFARRFTCGFVVQPRYIDQSLEEITRCVESLNLTVLCLPTHYQDNEGHWKETFNEDVDPIFELANQHGLAIEIHPYDGQKFIQLQDRSWRFHLIWMCAQTADNYHFFSLKDYAFRYPQVRFCFAHGNQFGQVNVGRRTQGYEGRPDFFEGDAHPKKNIGKSNVFFDTLVHDVHSFKILLDRQGVSQIIAGLDDPYPLGEMRGVADSYPGKVISDALEEGLISKDDYDNIWYRNVLNWLGSNPPMV
jgi:aminocarboxymuconate-semialdehyde decarboxylase